MPLCAVFLQLSRGDSDSFRLCANAMHKIAYNSVILLERILYNQLRNEFTVHFFYFS